MGKIPKGCFLVSRKIFESELWLDKPSSWTKLFIYIIGKVNHKDNGKFKRGENFFNFAEEYKLIDKNISLDTIKKALQYFRRKSILSTSRSTRGVVIKVNKYNTYQSLENYRGTQVGTREALEKHSDKQECKNDKNNISEPSSQSISPLKGEALFNSDDYIKNMLSDKQRHIQIVAKYFITRKSKFPSKKALQDELRRWLKDSRTIAEYPDEKINQTFALVLKKFPEEWNLSTIRKYINN